MPLRFFPSLKAKQQGKSPEQARAGAEGQAAIEAAPKLLRSLAGQEVSPDMTLSQKMMDRLDFKEGDGGYMIDSDGRLRPAELEEGVFKGLSHQEAALRTVAYLQARETCSVEDARKVAESPDAVRAVHARLQDFGTSRRPDFDDVDRPGWERRTEKLMEKVKEKLGCPEADSAHQLSWDVMKEEVLKSVREGDSDGLRRFVDEFARKRNSLLEEIKDDPEKHAALQQLLQDQQRDIQDKLSEVLEFMHSSKSDEDLHKSVEELLDHMNSYVGNLRPGHPSTNKKLQSHNDLHFNDKGEMCERSAWIHKNWPDKTRVIDGKVVSSVTDPKSGKPQDLPKGTST